MNDRLYRSRDERMLAGVAGGVAERFDVDPSLVRVLWVVLVFLSGGIFLLLYIAMAIVVPEAPAGPDRWSAWNSPSSPAPGAEWGSTAGPNPGVPRSAVPGWGGSTGSPPDAQAFASPTPPSSEVPPGPGAAPGSEAEPGSGMEPESETAPGPDAPPPAIAPPPPPATSSSWSMPAGSGQRHEHRGGNGGGAVIAGIVLVLVGGYFFIRAVAPQIDLGAFWPLILVVIGVALLVGSIRPGSGDNPAD